VGNKGRPTDYKKEYAAQATGLCRLGYIDKDLGNYFGVSEQTINAWKKKFPDFLEAIKEGKDDSDRMVVDSLFRKAIDGDTTAMIFWLKNRQKRNWRDKQDHELTGKDGEPLGFIIVPQKNSVEAD